MVKRWGVLKIFKDSIKYFIAHDTFTLGAALSYFTVFSVAPVLVIVISIVGSILGPAAVQGEVKEQIQEFLGSQGAQQVENLIKAVYLPGHNWLATTVAVVVLFIGATSVFSQMRISLNTIWEVKPQAKQPILQFLITRLFSFGIIICLAFLMLISLVIHAGVAGFTDYLNTRFSWFSAAVVHGSNILLSLFIATILFGFVYKYLSDARLKWAHIWQGALFTAMLFELGKYLIGLYIGKAGLADAYGAAGSGVLILLWVFYSSQIIFFGAEFTRSLANYHGVALDPKAIDVKKQLAPGIVNESEGPVQSD
jgi:membrane protein